MTERRHLPDHAPYSPSAMTRIIECPLSVSLSQQAPPEPESPYAKEGTTCHEHGEEALLSGVTPELEDKEMQAAVELYFNYCDPLIENSQHYGIEAKVVADEELFGTVDCWTYKDRVLRLIDLKYGYNPVSPEDNNQLLTYAACLFLDEDVKITEEMVDEIILTIVQPRGDGITSWSTTVARVTEHLKVVDGAITASKMDNPAGASGDHCRFCPARTICPILEAMEEGLLSWDSRDLTGKEIGELLHKAQLLEAKAKAIFNYAHARMEDGQSVAGWKLVPKRATRRWTDTKKLEAWAKRNGRLRTLFPPKLITPAQADKLLGEEYESVAKWVEAVSSGTNLKPSDDPADEAPSLGNALSAIGSLPKR